MFDNTEEFTIESIPGGVYEADCDKLREAVYKIPVAEYEKNTKGKRLTLSKCDSRSKGLIYRLFAESGMDFAQTKPFIDEELSYATIADDGSPETMVIISYFEERNLYEISFATSVEDNQIADLFNILVNSITDISDRMKEGDILRFSTPVGSVDRLAEKYFTKKLKLENYYLAGYNGETVG